MDIYNRSIKALVGVYGKGYQYLCHAPVLNKSTDASSWI